MAKKKAEKKAEKYSGPGAMKPSKGIIRMVKERTTPLTGSAKLEAPARETPEGKTIPAVYSYKGSPGGSPSADQVAESRAGKIDERREALEKKTFRPPTPTAAGKAKLPPVKLTDRKAKAGAETAEVRHSAKTGNWRKGPIRLDPDIERGNAVNELRKELSSDPESRPSRRRSDQDIYGTKTFARPLRGARPTGGGQHSRDNATPDLEASPEQAAQAEKQNRVTKWRSDLAPSLERARAQVAASDKDVLGQPRRDQQTSALSPIHKQTIEAAAHHAGQALQAAVSRNMNPRAQSTLVEHHRAEATRNASMIRGHAESLRRAGNMQVPCSTPGCQNMSVPLRTGQCPGGSCVFTPGRGKDIERVKADLKVKED